MPNGSASTAAEASSADSISDPDPASGPPSGVVGGEASSAETNGAVTDQPVDTERIERAVREILAAIGEDPDRDGLHKTPRRVARMYAEVFAGLREDPEHHLQVQFEAAHDEMVMVRDIPFYSMCEHHLLPFVGLAHVAYIPGDRGMITGLSKLARLVEAYARRPQVQERLTTQVADKLMAVLEPRGALVVVEAEHQCMSMRGVQKPGSLTITSAVRGQFRDTATRAEAMQLIGIGR
ncbi:GTP cyclohydrolase I FolE [Candidatus Poriferisodalis sp.]|uniref:GTP cyclohydrolase I FolE n=1 Tax=Candidatus Poriferisodalis sp. TaxID=3101277 RepID=UPI003B02446F